MIDPRSSQHLPEPFENVDGRRVRLHDGSSHHGRTGVIQYQLEHAIRGVRVQIELDDGNQVVACAGDLVFRSGTAHRRRRMTGVMPDGPSLLVRPSAWGVWDVAAGEWLRDAHHSPMLGFRSEQDATAALQDPPT